LRVRSDGAGSVLTVCGTVDPRVGTGMEVENDGLALQSREADVVAILIRQLEGGGFIPGLEH
jgi:hypothetical protein